MVLKLIETNKKGNFGELILTTANKLSCLYTEIFPEIPNFSKMNVLPNFLPQPTNIFTRIYLSYPWHFVTLLLLPFLLWGVALPHQQVQSDHPTKPLEPGTLWPLYLGFWHLLHIWSACWGVDQQLSRGKISNFLLCKVEPGVSGQLYALLGHQWVSSF